MAPLRIPQDPVKHFDRIRPRPNVRRTQKLPKPPRKPKPQKPPEPTDAELIANGAFEMLRARREKRARERRIRELQRRRLMAPRKVHRRRIVMKEAPPGASETLKRIVRWDGDV
jgi:hypothetical protein